MQITEIGLEIVPPGETLLEVMTDARISANDLALKTNRCTEYISGVCRGYCDIDEDFAKALDKVFRPPYMFWLRLQGIYNVERDKATKYRVDSCKEVKNYEN